MKRAFISLIGMCLLVMLVLGLSACDDSPFTNKVEFYSNGAVYTTAQANEDGKVSLPLAPTMKGYTFGGWFFDKDAYTSELTPDVYIDFSRLATVRVYAKWTANEYSITYNLPDSAVNANPTVYTVENEKITLAAATLDGHRFIGWYKDRELSNPVTEIDTSTAENVTLYAAFKKEYAFKINGNIEGAASFSGGAGEQTVLEDGSGYSQVVIGARLGYRFLYYEVNGVRGEGNVVTIPSAINANLNVTAYFDYATYELPIVNIDTSGQAITNKTDYVDMTFSLTNTDEEFEEIAGGIRLRGNSTMGFPKKPYRIKFDKKQGLFGLEKAKSWVLLADYIDPSGLHNYTAFNLAKDADGLSFTPSPYKVNVYLNGEYVGLYTLCEQVQENEGRMNIEEDITEDMTTLKDFNFFICMDSNAVADAGAKEGETYFYIEEYDKFFELKYPEKDQFVSDAQFEKFFDELVDYTKMILDAYAEGDVETIMAETNVSSLIDFMIIDQIMGERDHFWKSFNMYFTHTSENPEENNKLNFGPIWDYDWSLYTPYTGLPNQHYQIGNELEFSNTFFKGVAANEELYEMLKVRYNEHFDGVLQDYINNLGALEFSMAESLALNQQKWYGQTPDITAKNVAFLHRYLHSRLVLLRDVWSVE